MEQYSKVWKDDGNEIRWRLCLLRDGRTRALSLVPYIHVDDGFVPTAHTFSLGAPLQESGPLYDPCLVLVIVWMSTVANALGIARGAIESFIELATCTSSTASPTLLRDRPLVQTRVV